MKIEIKKTSSKEELNELGVFSWPVWEKEISEFPWHYDDKEICYILEGEVNVTPEAGDTVKFGKGDLVTFPAGMSCTWNVISPVKKHYRFG